MVDKNDKDGEAAKARVAECDSEIDRGLSSWWGNNEDLAKDIADRVVSFAAEDCEVDEVFIEGLVAGEPCHVRVMAWEDLKDRMPDLQHAANRLEGIFGRPVELVCCGISGNVYSSTCQEEPE